MENAALAVVQLRLELLTPPLAPGSATHLNNKKQEKGEK